MDLKKKVEDIFDIAGGPVTNIVSNMFLEGIVGQIAPGMMSMMLACRQKRSEKMVEKFIIETKKRQDEFENKLMKLDEQTVGEITDKYFGLVMDYVIKTKQEEKIKYIVNGFINLASMEKLQEDVILVYYDILDGLNLLDIRVLKLYDYLNETESFKNITQDAGITYEQYALIQNKLERLGLIENKAQSAYQELFKNVKNISEYLINHEKGKLKLKKFSNISGKSYVSTKLGREFLHFFILENKVPN